jgi:hypothetical protein
MDEFEKMVRMATACIAEYDRALAIIADSSDYDEIEKARDFLVNFQGIVSALQDQFLFMMSQLDQLDAKAQGAGTTVGDKLKARIRQSEVLMRKFVEVSRADLTNH